jgi:prevent-host-death family protein
MKTELVTTLKRQATRMLADLRKSRGSVLITEHGRPSAYLVDAKRYEMMTRRMRILEGIARGEMALTQGRTVTHEQAAKRMSRWLR